MSALPVTQRADVAEQVRRAAVELFATQGYANTSVAQIVAAAGVTKGAMYHYFASKDDLLFGIYDRLLSLQKARLDEIAAGEGDATSTLRAACIDVIETTIADLTAATVFFRSDHMLSPERRRDVIARRREYHEAFGALLRRGQDAGAFRRDIPEAVLIAHFFSDVHYLTRWYSPDGPLAPTEVATQLADLLLRSIRP